MKRLFSIITIACMLVFIVCALIYWFTNVYYNIGLVALIMFVVLVSVLRRGERRRKKK